MVVWYGRKSRRADLAVAVDVGQAADYTALVMGERKLEPIGKKYKASYQTVKGDQWDDIRNETQWVARQDVRQIIRVGHVERAPLRTPYTAVVDGVLRRIARVATPEVHVALLLDGTGVGRGVFDIAVERIRAQQKSGSLPTIHVVPLTVTGGTGESHRDGVWWRVPKHELISAAVNELQGDETVTSDGRSYPIPRPERSRIRWAPKQPYVKELEDELTNYRRKQNIATGAQTFEPWREKEHDDLLFALSMLAWYFWRTRVRYTDVKLASEPVAGQIFDAPEPAGVSPITSTPLPPLP